ncbi:MAG: hypothetical protein MZU97_07910 [Bacillus subtilis]|nr:hypothetical protein [Bacillus subtilis]
MPSFPFCPNPLCRLHLTEPPSGLVHPFRFLSNPHFRARSSIPLPSLPQNLLNPVIFPRLLRQASSWITRTSSIVTLPPRASGH